MASALKFPDMKVDRGEAGVVGLPPKALPEMTASPKAVIEPLASLPGRRQQYTAATRRAVSTNCMKISLTYCILALIASALDLTKTGNAIAARESPSLERIVPHKLG